MAKRKTKKQQKQNSKIYVKKYASMRGRSAPEYFLFGFAIAFALLFSFLSLMISQQMSTDIRLAELPDSNTRFKNHINNFVKGYPIEDMSPFIAREDKQVAAYLVAIAKKESNWGRFAPQKDGQMCYNYWGYRGSENPTESGFSCFDSPQQAVNVVGKRIDELIAQKIDTPQEMVVWKCGSTGCVHRDRGAAKWIWDVNSIYKEIAFR
ncbi:MAG: hypothetical protein PHF35_00565 [Candidatus Moranbacteria bacterium]|nr:hypothetical protein [Candidatus Moranbacteria bacterium]